ncbi:MAG TPA: hypothetical protein VEB23_08410 [Ramlibacter sp.]|nr:hypothetical protein [Ramlibacter sp.]
MQARLRFAQAVAPPSQDATPAPAAGGAARRAVPGDERIGALPPLVRPAPLAGVRRVGRRLQTQQRLGRLRQELSKIRPAPASPEEARDEILGALARAGLGDWTVPELDAADVRRCAGGSICIPLISHVVVLNPSGAFRIIDVFAGQHVYFEMAARDGAPFVLPPDAVLRA